MDIRLQQPGDPMSTPNPQFPALTDSISWTDSTTGVDGQPLPEGETVVSTTLGIRADGDTNFSAGSYQFQVAVAAPSQKESIGDLTLALAKALPPGNYWLAAKETAKLGDATADSAWSSEVGFSIPLAVAIPASPTDLAVH